MQGIPVLKSRKEKRKEARRIKTQQRLHQWVIHQAGKRKRAQKAAGHDEEEQEPATVKPLLSLKVKEDYAELEQENSTVVPSRRGKARRTEKDEKKEKKRKTKFEEFLERDMQRAALLNAEADLALERRLAKKLKVKGGKLGGFDDGMADILDGLGEGAEILVTEEDAPNPKTLKKNPKQVSDSETLFPKNTKQGGSSKEEVIGSDHENSDSDGYLQNMLMDDEDDSEDAEDELSGSEEEDQEESELGLETSDSDGVLANAHPMDDSEEGEEDDSDGEGEEEDESDEGEEETEDDSEDDTRDVSLSDGAKQETEVLKEKSKQKDVGATDIYGRKKVDAAVKYVPPHLRGKASDASEEMIRIQRRLRGMILTASFNWSLQCVPWV